MIFGSSSLLLGGVSTHYSHPAQQHSTARQYSTVCMLAFLIRRCLFYCSRARARVFAAMPRKKVGRLIAGSCFGATAALHGGGLRQESVTCVTDCEMYTIEGKALRRIARCVCVCVLAHRLSRHARGLAAGGYVGLVFFLAFYQRITHTRAVLFTRGPSATLARANRRRSGRVSLVAVSELEPLAAH